MQVLNLSLSRPKHVLSKSNLYVVLSVQLYNVLVYIFQCPKSITMYTKTRQIVEKRYPWQVVRAKYTRPIGENIGRILEMLNRKLEEYWKC